MKKLLLASVACGALAIATPASADDHGIKLELGGHAKAYGVYTDQDEFEAGAAEADVRDFDILRETEIHFNGEKTLDNGLTVGVHIETDLDGGDEFTDVDGDQIALEESYVYFSGDWGRVNLGREDGAAYLLQVAAPSADSNIDGIRQFINPINVGALVSTSGSVTGTVFGDVVSNFNTGAFRLDYDQAITEFDNKLTYITPVFAGFQAGISYTPELDDDNNGLGGVSLDDEGFDSFGDAFDFAARYEGQFEGLGVALGAGYTIANQEDVDGATLTSGDLSDDLEAYNIGLDLDWGPFGLGASWSENNFGEAVITTTPAEEADDEQTLVIGADYTHGPYKLGVSYFDQENTNGIQDVDVERWTGGIVYTYGPGMTFRGSVSYVQFDDEQDTPSFFGTGEDDADATSVLIGTQISF